MKKENFRNEIDEMDENEKIPTALKSLKRFDKKILSPKIRKTWLTLKYDQQCNTI